MKRINLAEYGFGVPEESAHIMKILRVAKSQTGDPYLEKRLEDAMLAIGIHWLEWVEAKYEPEKKKYRVNIEGSRAVEVMAENETKALEIVDSSDDSAREHEVYGAVEVVK